MKATLKIVLYFIFLFSVGIAKSQDSAVHDIVVQYISWQDTLMQEPASFRDSINAIRDSARSITDSLKMIQDSVNAIRDSVLSDSVNRHWTGWKKYQVQAAHTYTINTKNALKGKKKAELQYNIADFYLYLNGQLVKPPKSVNNFFAAGCLSFKYDDTLLLNSGLGFKVGVGVGIKVFRNHFTSTLHANKHNTEIYKESKDDSAYLKSIIAEPVTQSLKLLKEPENKVGEIIIGEYQATYKKFYEKNEDDQDEVRRYTVRIVFRCRTSGGIESLKSSGASNRN
jgi:hypothetical protein